MSATLVVVVLVVVAFVGGAVLMWRNKAKVDSTVADAEAKAKDAQAKVTSILDAFKK